MAEGFWPGQAAPDFLVNEPDDRPVTFYERYCGRETVLVFLPADEGAPDFEQLAERVQLLVIVQTESSAAWNDDVATLVDDGRIARAIPGVEFDDRPVTVVLRNNLAVESVLQGVDISAVTSVLDGMPETAPLQLSAGVAPVLIVSDLLPPATCQRLIAAHEDANHESGMLREVDGGVTLVPDAATKKRRDHQLVDQDLVNNVTQALVDRLLPAIQKSFNYAVTRMEGFKVVAYDGSTGGYFRMHRDNVTPDAEHRRFALSLNLNDDYEGGELVFPEFGPCRYRPPAGGAIVFSGTHLHGAQDVTKGKRYVLLTFLWGDDAA